MRQKVQDQSNSGGSIGMGTDKEAIVKAIEAKGARLAQLDKRQSSPFGCKK
jgi:hypothetical protein